MMSIKYWKPENEFHYSPPWRGAGVGLLERYSLFWFPIFYNTAN